MGGYIDRDALMEYTDNQVSKSISNNDIARFPMADVAPVVHGKWVDHFVRDWRCSECGGKIYKVRKVDGYCFDDKPNYCPDCGAKMDGGKANE